MDYTRTCPSPLGAITLASDGQSLTGLWFPGQAHFGAGLSPLCQIGNLPIFDETEKWLLAYFSGKEPRSWPPLSPRGTPYQLCVWSVLSAIPYGQTLTYKDVAIRAAKRAGGGGASARAAGNAIARNPISLLIPCHRVVGSDGCLVGYAGGLERKRFLLQLEGAL